MRILNYAWRLVRPHVYSADDYAALAESDPGALTVAEMRMLNRVATDAGRIRRELEQDARRRGVRLNLG